MKFLGGIIEISSIKTGQYPGDNSGDSLIATVAGTSEKGETAQVYGQAGFISSPPKGTKGVRLRIGSIDIVIASFNYKASIPVNQGETIVSSTDSEGNEKAKHYLDDQGVHTFNDGTLQAARKDDPTLVNNVTDPAMIAWIATVSAFINGLAPGTIPTPPTTITGKINDGSSEVLIP